MKNLFLLFLPLFFLSCTQEEPAPKVEQDDLELIASCEDEDIVNHIDLANFVKHFKPSNSRANGYTVSTIKNEVADTGVNSTIPLIKSIHLSAGRFTISQKNNTLFQ